MLSVRLFFVLLVACATLLMSFRAPGATTVQQKVSTDGWAQNAIELPLEESQSAEESTTTGQQGPLEEIHDMHCSVDRQQLTLWQQDEVSCNRLHPLLWMRIPLMSCFQPPEQA